MRRWKLTLEEQGTAPLGHAARGPLGPALGQGCLQTKQLEGVRAEVLQRSFCVCREGRVVGCYSEKRMETFVLRNVTEFPFSV